MDGTKIEWTDVTDNIIVVEGGGHWCHKLSPGCENCYAEEFNDNSFFGGNHLPYTGNPPTLKLRHDIIEKWARQRKPRKHFVASMTDVFGKWVARAWQFEFLDGMLAASLQTFQLLTKRADVLLMAVKSWMAARGITKPPKNIWLGFTAENQKEFDRRWQSMKQLAAMGWTVFVSCEPLLSHITLPEDFLAFGSQVQVIVGGESGKNARPMHPDWATSLRDQCVAAGVPFFFKQWGEYAPHEWKGNGGRLASRQRVALSGQTKWTEEEWQEWVRDGRYKTEVARMYRYGKKAAGRLLDGRTWDEYPSGEAR